MASRVVTATSHASGVSTLARSAPCQRSRTSCTRSSASCTLPSIRKAMPNRLGRYLSPPASKEGAWTEAVTLLGREGDEQLVRLTMAIVAINGWNRLNIAFLSEVGSYQPPHRTEAAVR